MKKLLVNYEGWGEKWPLGTLADNGAQLLFEYTPEALKQGLELSPRHLKLRPQAYGDFPDFLHRLPGLVEDCLPDGWGLLLMDRLFRKSGCDPYTLSPLDRLAHIGGRAMGALTFEPAGRQALTKEDVDLLALARQAQEVVAGKDTEALRRLALLGGSPHGARPKVLVHYHPRTHAMRTAPAPGAQPWLVKFQAGGEHKEVCAVEAFYAGMARVCGLDMPMTRHFDLGKSLAAFGTARFDVQDGMRVPVHTLAGLLHVNFRVIGAVDYTTFLRATRFLTRSEVQVRKAYDRAAFNVLMNVRDDHPKNISFRLNPRRQWELAPCYDLTFDEGPRGEHQMDVCGEGRSITRAHMLELARQGGLEERYAKGVIDGMRERILSTATLGHMEGVRPQTRERIAAAVKANVQRLQ